jgi:hypothetical protein
LGASRYNTSRRSLGLSQTLSSSRITQSGGSRSNQSNNVIWNHLRNKIRDGSTQDPSPGDLELRPQGTLFKKDIAEQSPTTTNTSDNYLLTLLKGCEDIHTIIIETTLNVTARVPSIQTHKRDSRYDINTVHNAGNLNGLIPKHFIRGDSVGVVGDTEIHSRHRTIDKRDLSFRLSHYDLVRSDMRIDMTINSGYQDCDNDEEDNRQQGDKADSEVTGRESISRLKSHTHLLKKDEEGIGCGVPAPTRGYSTNP